MTQKKMKSALELDRYMATRPAPEEGLEYHAPFEAPIRLSGLGFPELGARFRRLPVRPDGTPSVSERVDVLADYTAGVQLAFRSDSRKVTVKAKLGTDAVMQHMPQTGSSSFDLYVGGPGAWRAVTSAAYTLHATEFSAILFDRPEPGEREYLLHFPLYNGVHEVWIGLENGSTILPPTPWKETKPVVVYGTSITQGGCAARPGMAWTNLLARWRNQPFINLGFSGNGRGEPEMAEYLTRIADPAAFILDYEANAGYTGLQNTLERFVAILREKHPAVPIVLISAIPHRWQICFGAGDGPEAHPEYQQSREWQKSVAARLRAEGDSNFRFIDGSQLLGMDWDECMVDGCHLTDLGFYRMAEALNKRLPF